MKAHEWIEERRLMREQIAELERQRDALQVSYNTAQHGYDALVVKVNALVAENAALKSCAEFYNASFSPVKGTFGLEWKPTEKLLDDCGNVASDALKTPATDAALREIGAKAVEAFADTEADFAMRNIGSLGDRLNYAGSAHSARVFAQQLREGKV